MKHYDLQSDEVVLFEDDIVSHESNESKHLILTNYYIVVVTTLKRLFKKEEVTVDTYPVTDVKIYDEKPQVKQSFCDVTVYLLSGELEFEFDFLPKATSFTNKMIELLTGKAMSTRGAEKVKGAIGIVDKALGIDTMSTLSGILENGLGGTLFRGIGSKKKASSGSGKIASAANATAAVINAVNAAKQPEKAEQLEEKATDMTYEQQIETLKKLKELLDMGVISQEDFDIKKKELLNL